jgi:hypothetical protein
VFDDAHSYAGATSQISLTSDYSSFDRRARSLTWTMRQPNYQADSRGESHPSWQTQVQSGGTDVIEQAIETERMIVDVNTPNTRRKRARRTRF